MKTKFGELFVEKELKEVREKFAYVDHDFVGNKRIFFDNAGGALRLTKAEDVFKKVDLVPDCSEHSNKIALMLKKIDEQGRADIRTIFNAKKGSLVFGFTASQLMMQAMRVVAASVKGTNVVTTALEHPSAFDALKIQARKYNWELRIAHANKLTGGIDTETILNLIDKNTAILSVMSASNISGHIMDVSTVASRAREINPDIIIVSDAVQHAPHGILNPEQSGIDVMNIAPYKFFSIRGMGLMFMSERVNKMEHDQVECLPDDMWELGSPSTAQFAAITEIVNYVCELGKHKLESATSRRELFELGMERIANHERALLEIMLEGTDAVKGLRYIDGIRVLMDDPDLYQRDLITGIEFANMGPQQACAELEKRGIVAFERVASSEFSARMVHEFDSEGIVRISPLHVNTPEEIEQFLHTVKEVAAL